jgi:ParB/RepB/Spo0J family partition protein
MSEPEEEYSLLPVERCTIHPLARIRFDYEVDELAESIRTMGQVQPGRAVRQGGPGGEKASYLIYIGCRRLLACKKASLKHFKAMVVGSIDEGRLQRELLTENVKRANLSVLEELNLLGNYSRRLSSLEELARDLGLSQRLVRARVKLAILTQDKGLVETLYKIERISEYRFTYLHMEKLTALEEVKWLPAAIHAAERNWKAEEIESLGEQDRRNRVREPEHGRTEEKRIERGVKGATGAGTTHRKGRGDGALAHRAPRLHEQGGHRAEVHREGDHDKRQVGLQVPEDSHRQGAPSEGGERLRADRARKEAAAPRYAVICIRRGEFSLLSVSIRAFNRKSSIHPRIRLNSIVDDVGAGSHAIIRLASARDKLAPPHRERLKERPRRKLCADRGRTRSNFSSL